jgi:DNA primase small subunit
LVEYVQRKNDLKNTQLFLEREFANFYETAFHNDALPSNLNQREFGFLSFKDNLMLRHLQFRTPHELNKFLSSFTPLHAYYSSAYYGQPDAPMDKKNWYGADLVFDIDADHLILPCESTHTYWICSECNQPSTQLRQVCPSCGSRKIKQEAWLCDTCLQNAKTEAQKLLDFLLNDLGIPLTDLEIRFSGHRGYHVAVTQEDIKNLDQAARKEIVDYVLGTGLNIELHGLAKTTGRSKRLIGPKRNDSGWKGRIARGLHDYVSSMESKDFAQFPNLSSKKRDNILREWKAHGNPWSIRNIDEETWYKLTLLGIQNQGSHVDTVVTTDLHRLIRLPNTLHGKTGLRVTSIPYSSLDEFDPLTDGVVFRNGQIKIHVISAHKFRLGDASYGPFNNESLELPLAAAIFLLCKKAARLAR